MANKFKRPKITWGSSFANTLTFGYQLDNWSSYSEARDGSETIKSVAGNVDSWRTGTDYMLKAQARWIPTADTTSPVASGWDGTTGWRSFLEYAQDQNPIRFFGDATTGTFITCYLQSPVGPNSVASSLAVEPDATRSITFTLYSSGSAFDGY